MRTLMAPVIVLLAFGHGSVCFAQSNDAPRPAELTVDIAGLPERPVAPSRIGCDSARESEALPLDVTVASEILARLQLPVTNFKTSVVGTAPARPRVLLPLYTAFVCLESADTYFTWLGIRRGALELNPITAHATGNALKLLGLKAATSAATLHFSERDRKEHPKRALFTMAAINGAMSWVVWHDRQVARRAVSFNNK